MSRNEPDRRLLRRTCGAASSPSFTPRIARVPNGQSEDTLGSVLRFHLLRWSRSCSSSLRSHAARTAACATVGGRLCQSRSSHHILRLMGTFSEPPWSRWSTLPAGWRFATRDSARGTPITLGRLRTCARCRRDTAPISSKWTGSIPAASTFNNNFIILLHDRPPKSQERPNGRVRGRALCLVLPGGERSAAWPFLGRTCRWLHECSPS
jgi:hypothetical protein